MALCPVPPNKRGRCFSSSLPRIRSAPCWTLFAFVTRLRVLLLPTSSRVTSRHWGGRRVRRVMSLPMAWGRYS